MLSLVALLVLSLPGQAVQTPAPVVVVAPVEDPAVTALAVKIYGQMRAGKVDAALLSPEMQKALTPEMLTQSKPMFDQLGDPTKLALEKKDAANGGMSYVYLATFAAAQFHVSIFIDKDGKVGGYRLYP